MNREDNPEWYAVSTWTTRLTDVRAELVGLGICHYVPTETVERRIGRKLRPVRRPVWPGYVFVHCDPRDFGRVRDVEGIHDFVRVERAPVKLGPNALVPVLLAELLGELDYTRKPAAWKPSRGDRAKVGSGMWRGYLGRVISVAKRKTIIELDKGRGRLTVETEALERAA